MMPDPTRLRTALVNLVEAAEQLRTAAEFVLADAGIDHVGTVNVESLRARCETIEAARMDARAALAYAV